MTTTIKTTPTIARANGSHYLTLSTGYSPGEPFGKEELYPILEVTAPRAGLVRATFEANRYVYNASSAPEWSDWRIFLRDVRTPDPDKPDVPHLGQLAAGIGDVTRAAISTACIPVIRAWLESDAYPRARQLAAARAVVQSLDAPADYTIDRGERLLGEAADALAVNDRAAIAAALRDLRAARAVLDAIGKD